MLGATRLAIPRPVGPLWLATLCPGKAQRLSSPQSTSTCPRPYGAYWPILRLIYFPLATCVKVSHIAPHFSQPDNSIDGDYGPGHGKLDCGLLSHCGSPGHSVASHSGPSGRGMASLVAASNGIDLITQNATNDGSHLHD